MKLYVWRGVLTDYTDGIIFAMAPSLKAARAAVLKDSSWSRDAVQEAIDCVKPEVFTKTHGEFLYGGG